MDTSQKPKSVFNLHSSPSLCLFSCDPMTSNLPKNKEDMG